MKKLMIVLGSLLLLTGCASNMNTNKNELVEIVNENNYILVDVRTKEEYETGHLKDAINVPVDEIDENIFDESKTIMVYCRSGVRSKKAYDILIKNGYKAYDLGAYDKIDKFEKVK